MDIKTSYEAMSSALNKTGRHIHFNMYFNPTTNTKLNPLTLTLTHSRQLSRSLTCASGVRSHLGLGVTLWPRCRNVAMILSITSSAFFIIFVQSWRMSGDHTGNWDSTQSIILQSAAIPFENSGRPYGWNDMDMLETG